MSDAVMNLRHAVDAYVSLDTTTADRSRSKRRIKECADHGSLHQSGHNWCDRGWTISACYFDAGTLGSGRILASFHCLGIVDVASDMLNR